MKNSLQGRRPTFAFIATWGFRGQDYTLPMWYGAIETAREMDINLVGFTDVDIYNLKVCQSTYSQLAGDHFDGVILINPSFADISKKLFGNIPVVNIGMQANDVTSSIIVDNKSGMKAAMSHLIEKHHRQKITFIYATGRSDLVERYEAYREALELHNIPYDPKMVFDTTPFGEGREQELSAVQAALKYWIDEEHIPFDGFASAMFSPIEPVLTVLQKRGIRVPQDVAVTGFYKDIDIQTTVPSVTTILQPLNQMGRLSVEILNAKLNGKSVEPLHKLPTELVILRSCGCFAENVKQAADVSSAKAESLASRAMLLKQRLNARRESMLKAVEAALGEQVTRINPQWSIRLVDKFIEVLLQKSSDLFLAELDQILQEMMVQNIHLSVLQPAVTALRLEVNQITNGQKQTENLFHQARVLVDELVFQQQTLKQLDESKRIANLHAITQKMSATFDVKELMDILAGDLHKLEITGCYVALYDGIQRPAESARLILACSGTQRVSLPPEGIQFPMSQLVPEKILPADRHHYVYETLLFQNEELGFILFEMGPNHDALYVTLRDQLASALKGALLFEQNNHLLDQVAINARNVKTASDQMAEAATQSGSATNQVAGTISDVARGANQQARSLSQAIETLDQINRLIQASASAIETTLASTQLAAKSAQSGSQTVTSNITRMSQLKTAVDESAVRVQEMGEFSNKIGSMVDLIRDMASQTNLLALNASIEAAHAGEHGRGFAVVAAEVRKLAEESTTATQQISSLVTDIQKSVSSASKAMQRGMDEVEVAVNLSRQSGEALAGILNAVETVNTQMQMLKKSSVDLGTASTQITGAIENAASVSEENSAAAEEVSASADELRSQIGSVTEAAASLADLARMMADLSAKFSPEE